MRAFAVLLGFGLAGCSTPTTTATKDPATTANTPVTAPTPTATNAIATARTLAFAYDVSREISCSQSFEDDSTYGSYVLTLTPPHAATLVYERVQTHRFGANQFGPGASPPNVSEQRFASTYEGTVVQDGGVLTLSLHRRKDDCAAGDSSCDGTLALSCASSIDSIVSFDDKGRHVSDRSVVRCSPGFGLPLELAEGGWKGGLAFGDGPGFFLEYPQVGPMEHPPELRLGF